MSPLAATTSSAADDRGVIHQALTALGVGTGTAHTIQVVADGPVRVVIVLVVAFILTRFVARAANRLVRSFRLVSPLVGATQRGADRARTLAGVFASIFRALIWVIAVLTILGELGIQLGPFVATATVIGAAVGFGAQTLVKDFLSGVLILAEDQYGVGDSVTIASSKTSGVVESVNLRTTRVRAVDGVVWYVPNGDIRAVGNGSESDTQALVDLVVPHGVDLAEAGELGRLAVADLATDDVWRTQITGPPTFAGIVAEDQNGVTLRLTLTTKPGQDVPVARQARLRILEAWRRNGFGFEAAASPAAAGAAASPALVAAEPHALVRVAPPGDLGESALGGPVGAPAPLPDVPDHPGAPPTPRAGLHRPHLFRPHRQRDT
jgi:small-conductance mechanosensitive channel